MKKILISLLILVLIFTFASCGAQNDPVQDEPVEAQEEPAVTETTALTDASWMTAASEDETDKYIDTLYENTDTAKNVRIASLKLFKALSEKDMDEGKNTMISPLSFLTAMGLLENGANGDTLKEIEDVFGMDIGSFNSWYDAWSKLMALNGGDVLKVANSVWYKADPTLNVSEEFLKKTAEVYKAQAFEAPFDEKTLKDINGWVNDNTNGMIPSVLDNISKDAMLFLINATCFEGEWFNEYEDDQIIENETFTREDGTEDKVTMLSSREEGTGYYENDFLTGVSKSYKDGYKITFLLPKEGVTVKDALSRLEGDSIAELINDGSLSDVDLYIPEFSFDYTAPDCVNTLKDMGITTVFDPEMADLSPMAETADGTNLSVDTVIHKTHIELDREGTRAAASTVIGIVKNTALQEKLPLREVRLDRPFIFVISDFQTETPIFMGTVASIEG